MKVLSLFLKTKRNFDEFALTLQQGNEEFAGEVRLTTILPKWQTNSPGEKEFLCS